MTTTNDDENDMISTEPFLPRDDEIQQQEGEGERRRFVNGGDEEEVVTENDTENRADAVVVNDNDENTDDPATSSGDASSVDTRIRYWQEMGCIVSHVLSVVCVVLVTMWVFSLGGFIPLYPASATHGKAKLVFNWHPFLMILAFANMTTASLAFLTSTIMMNQNNRQQQRWKAKLVHASGWIVAAICACFGLIAVVRSHDDKDSGYIANMYSFHSWLGGGVILLYLRQFMIGFWTFTNWWEWIPCYRPQCLVRIMDTWLTPRIKSNVLKFHTFMGPLIYVSVSATILSGIQEKEGFVKCSYPVKPEDGPDIWPIMHLTDIPYPCLISHTLGLVVLLTTLCTMFVLHDFS